MPLFTLTDYGHILPFLHTESLKEVNFIFVLLQSVTLPDGKYTVPTKVCTTVKSLQ